MSVSTTTLKRLPTIKQGLIEGLTREQIGDTCGVTEKTIRRDIQAWVESGLFETWIRIEFLRLHTNIIHEDPVEAYRQISKLVGKTLIHRVEAKQEIEHVTQPDVDWNKLTEEEKNVFRMCAAIRRAHSAKERPDRIH